MDFSIKNSEPSSTWYPVLVYFASARHPQGWWRGLRESRRRGWWRVRCYLLSWLIRLLTRSVDAHCMVGWDGVVLDPSYAGRRFHAHWSVIEHYTSLTAIVQVATPLPPPLPEIKPDRVRPRGWPTFMRWLTRGRTPAYDCLTQTSDLLRAAGLNVPPFVTVTALRRWLESLPCSKPYPLTPKA